MIDNRLWRFGALAACCLLVVLGSAACGNGDETPTPVVVAGGDPERGREALIRYECNTCHRIPGVETENGRTAPALTVWANRAFVAGIMPNTPENVMDFIQDPQRYRPGTAMPDLGVTDDDARDIAAYLFTLR
jgi:cytochrome c